MIVRLQQFPAASIEQLRLESGDAYTLRRWLEWQHPGAEPFELPRDRRSELPGMWSVKRWKDAVGILLAGGFLVAALVPHVKPSSERARMKTAKASQNT